MLPPPPRHRGRGQQVRGYAGLASDFSSSPIRDVQNRKIWAFCNRQPSLAIFFWCEGGDPGAEGWADPVPPRAGWVSRRPFYFFSWLNEAGAARPVTTPGYRHPPDPQPADRMAISWPRDLAAIWQSTADRQKPVDRLADPTC